MRERDLQTRVTRYMKNRWQGGPAAFELKITDGPSIPFAAVKEHQVAALLLAKHGRLTYKIPDEGISQKPFDMFILTKAEAYVVFMYHTKGCNKVYLIDIDAFLKEKKASECPTDGSRPRKSLTEERAAAIGRVIILGADGNIE